MLIISSSRLHAKAFLVIPIQQRPKPNSNKSSILTAAADCLQKTQNARCSQPKTPGDHRATAVEDDFCNWVKNRKVIRLSKGKCTHIYLIDTPGLSDAHRPDKDIGPRDIFEMASNILLPKSWTS
jgi:hypothetical protein